MMMLENQWYVWHAFRYGKTKEVCLCVWYLERWVCGRNWEGGGKKAKKLRVGGRGGEGRGWEVGMRRFVVHS